MRLRVVVDRGCRGVWLVLKVGNEGYATNHSLFIIDIDLCNFEFFL